MDEEKIKELEKSARFLKNLEKDVASVEEVAELVATIIQVVKETKEFLEKQASDNKKELNSFVNRVTEQEVQKIAEALDVLEKKAEKVIKRIKHTLEIDGVTKPTDDEIRQFLGEHQRKPGHGRKQ